ncbi:MAG: bifunctional diaminohydroxyphosphoribosylaminopyrimidine deaminase/5-amino-6-(5-phosphoribosylamino)uracil reductase RibD [Planctomycetota bacterium]|nr:bifunctional diaminohydroxyphosphoribosylaminopyrimidine deaminase/5-amino-6-(5-phosphoribosylamino)uracil reductase RibD [Planctomycetota bacterium]
MALTDHDERLLRRAIALARKARFDVEPNPAVGCVLDRGEDGVVGEGWTAPWGGPHAEAVALAVAGERARGATAYVSLGPCGVHAKTPPCADALVSAGVRRVVVGVGDPSPAEAGAGLARLREASIQVDLAEGTLQREADEGLERFRRTLGRRRPWVVLKWAMSLDGRIAAARGSGGAISGRRAQRLLHTWRAHSDAVAVGIDTALIDDPQLTCRLADGPPHGRPQPRRVVFDSSLRLPASSAMVRSAAEVQVLVVCGEDADHARRTALESSDVAVLPVPVVDGRVDLGAALEALYVHGVRRLLVEGGAKIHGAFLKAGLADQVSAFVAPRILGGKDAVPAVEGSGIDTAEAMQDLEEVMWRRLGDDLLMQGYVPA